MADGTLVLALTVALSGHEERRASDAGTMDTFLDESRRDDVMMFSTNGEDWTQPVLIPGYRTTPMTLGGDRLMLRGWTSKISSRQPIQYTACVGLSLIFYKVTVRKKRKKMEIDFR